jgi:photosystem II stability/assembly factor-like uncharacterized protein
MRQLLIATKKGLFVASETRTGWTLDEPLFRGVAVSMVLPDPRDKALYVGLDHGHFGAKIHRRIGKRWSELPAPRYPQLAKGKVDTDSSGRPWPRSLRLIWSLEIDPRTAGGIWCGTIPGGLFHSADRGASWQFQTKLWNEPGRKQWQGGGYDTPGIHSILVDPRDAQRVTLGVSCGGVWRTEDGGKRWRNTAHGMRAAYLPPKLAYSIDTQDPHRLAMCTGNPDRVWCQHHNGIFVQKPDGSWREVKAKAPSRFGFACAAHPYDPDVAWFVPAQKDECRVPVDGKLVVLRTDDGGRSFQQLRRGLPQAHAYDLVWRHGLALASDGATLAMGSTSGRLWLGTDGGERWHEFAVNLPPITTVRWLERE